MTQNRWYNVEPTNKQILTAGKYMYAKKSSEEGKVIIFNGRHYIQVVTTDFARENFKMGKVVKDQEFTQKEFDWYVHY